MDLIGFLSNIHNWTDTYLCIYSKKNFARLFINKMSVRLPTLLYHIAYLSFSISLHLLLLATYFHHSLLFKSPLSLQDAFNQAAEAVKGLSKDPTNDEKLRLYGLFKQVTVGDCNTGTIHFFCGFLFLSVK